MSRGLLRGAVALHLLLHLSRGGAAAAETERVMAPGLGELLPGDHPAAPGRRAVARQLGPGARLTVLYWPALGQCAPVEGGLIDVLTEYQARFADTRVVTVVPENLRAPERYGRALPGQILEISRRDFNEQVLFSPFPRVEIWDAHGVMLLFRAVSAVATEPSTVAAELERARSFTRPLELAQQPF